MWDTSTENRRYLASQRGGEDREVTVFDRDQQAADALYRIYRAGCGCKARYRAARR